MKKKVEKTQVKYADKDWLELEIENRVHPKKIAKRFNGRLGDIFPFRMIVRNVYMKLIHLIRSGGKILYEIQKQI